jgi:hypothetical protein
VIGDLVPRSALRDPDVEAMFELFRAHFDNVDEHDFRADLADKQWVVRIRSGRSLLGFTSLKYFSLLHGGAQLKVLYSGDTIVAPEARCSTVFARSWIGAVRQLGSYYDAREFYWLLLVSGFRTYRFLPVFWREFFPVFDRGTPAVEQRRMDAAARQLFAERYLADRGIVRFERPQRLRSDQRGIASNRLRDPHVACFAARNPGFRHGDELVCWTRLADANLTAAGQRMWQAAESERAVQLAG